MIVSSLQVVGARVFTIDLHAMYRKPVFGTIEAAMPEEYILVIVAPGDSIHTITHRIRETRTSNIELLVPEGVRSLQNPDGFVRLRWSLDLSRVKLLVITPDEATLRSAQTNNIETMSVPRSAQTHLGKLPLAGLLRAAATKIDRIDEKGSIFERLKQHAADTAVPA